MAEEMTYLADEFEDTQKDKFLTFSVDRDIYGLDISHVIEIIGVQEITQIPNQLSCIRGVINLRGKIIPTMDIRLRFGKPPREYDDRTCIVVLEINELTVGIIVDTVVEVTCIPENIISAPPDFGRSGGNQFIKGIGTIEESVKLLLDSDRLLNHEDLMLGGEDFVGSDALAQQGVFPG